MSKVAMIENSMGRCLLDMPYDLLFDILRRLPKKKLVEISKLCSIFRDVAGDTLFWKDVYIKHGQKVVAFEELYSEPWPVNVIDLEGTEIKPPVSSKIDQVVKVRKLDLSSIRANKVTMEALLSKYQCRELHLNFNSVQGQNIMGIAPEAFLKQTALEVLELGNISRSRMTKNISRGKVYVLPLSCELWLAPVLDNCKNLKELDLSFNYMCNSDMLGFVRNLPISLKVLSLPFNMPEDSFFQMLAERNPNLKELKLGTEIIAKCPSLIRFQFLEVLYVFPDGKNFPQYSSDLYKYLIKFPALKTVYMNCPLFTRPKTYLGNLPKDLEPHGIIVKPTEHPGAPPFPEDCTLWKVSTVK